MKTIFPTSFLAALLCLLHGQVATSSENADEEAATSVVVLDDNNFLEKVQGKSVFIKFYAPWCEHCKAMEADWEKIAQEWVSSKTGLIAQVDCGAEVNELLCEEYAVDSYPTLLYGDAFSPEIYEDERTYEPMAAFAQQHLNQLPCNIKNIDVCPEKAQKVLRELLAKSRDELEDLEVQVDTELAKAETEYDEEVSRINDEYQKILDKLNAQIQQIREERHYKWLQMVLAETDESFPDLDAAGSDEL